MPTPNQKVIVYRVGLKKGPVEKSFTRNQKTAEYFGRDKVCPRCNKKLKNPERRHMQDSYNKIPCIVPR